MCVNDIPVVILAGGKGLRMREYTEVMPKALVQIGSYPVVLHVMKIYAKFGFKRFILSTGYKGHMLEEYFQNGIDFDVTCVNTGEETQTGGRVKLLEKHIPEDDFFVTYCDGVCDLDIQHLYSFHKKTNKIATLTAVHPMNTFGMLEIGNDNVI